MSDIYTVKMPDIGEGVVEGEVIEWLKKTNDTVQKDEAVVIVMTDKATVELPSPYPGVLIKQHVPRGQIAIKDHPLYDLEVDSKEKIQKTTDSLPVEQTKASTVTSPPPKKEYNSSKVLASPPIRKIAHDLEIDIELIKGTGKEGHVTIEDIKNFIAHSSSSLLNKTPLSPFSDDDQIPIIGIQNLMAHKMKESKAEIPHFSYLEQVDAHRLIQLRQNIKEKAQNVGMHLTFMPFLIRALSLTIHKYPILNSSLNLPDKLLLQHKHHHIGIAISGRLGLIVPVLKNVEQMDLTQVIENYDSLKKRALENKLHSDDMKGATITLSNFGVSGGGLWATPIINFPEVAILATAKIHKIPIVKNDQIVIQSMLNLSWSFDHRVIDGNLAASISQYFCSLIQNPAALLVEFEVRTNT